MKLLPDTNVLIYETVEDSPHHKEACMILDNSTEIFIPSIVIHEFFWAALRLGINIKIVLTKIEEYLGDPRTYYFTESLDIYRRAFNMFFEDNVDYREINDYIILAVALSEKTILATYDEDLRRRAVKRGVNVVPKRSIS